MINISDCPDTGLKRKLDYNFLWYKRTRQIIIECFVEHFKSDSTTPVDNKRIQSYSRNLVASNSLVNPTNGTILTEEQLADISSLGYTPIEEYDFYKVLAEVPLVLRTKIEELIAYRDAEGKFNI